MNTQPDDQDVVTNSAYNPFPEPQTIPSGWDLSGLTSTPPLESGRDEDDSGES